jgi:hypothetical protein
MQLGNVATTHRYRSYQLMDSFMTRFFQCLFVFSAEIQLISQIIYDLLQRKRRSYRRRPPLIIPLDYQLKLSLIRMVEKKVINEAKNSLHNRIYRKGNEENTRCTFN